MRTISACALTPMLQLLRSATAAMTWNLAGWEPIPPRAAAASDFGSTHNQFGRYDVRCPPGSITCLRPRVTGASQRRAFPPPDLDLAEAGLGLIPVHDDRRESLERHPGLLIDFLGRPDDDRVASQLFELTGE